MTYVRFTINMEYFNSIPITDVAQHDITVGRRGRMVVGVTNTYAISAYHH